MEIHEDKAVAKLDSQERCSATAIQRFVCAASRRVGCKATCHSLQSKSLGQ